MYEYKFVRIASRFLSAEPAQDYHPVVEDHAERGWRLVQIVTPGHPVYGGGAGYFELIFERPVPEG